jgi:uncharacterized protein (DUF1697 family)
MYSHVALLYSIGISDGRRLAMADWRTMMEGIGLEHPRTLIATGNAVFACQGASIRQIEKRLRLTAANPFPEESTRNGARVAVRIMRKSLTEDAVAALEPYATQGERLRLVNGDLWMHFPQEPNRSRLPPFLTSKHLGVGTIRNWNTVRRLDEMLAG